MMARQVAQLQWEPLFHYVAQLPSRARISFSPGYETTCHTCSRTAAGKMLNSRGKTTWEKESDSRKIGLLRGSSRMLAQHEISDPDVRSHVRFEEATHPSHMSMKHMGHIRCDMLHCNK